MKKFLLFLIVLPLLISCSGDLTRKEAKKQILEKFKYPLDETIKVITYDNTFGKGSTINDLEVYKKLGLLNYTYRRGGPVRATLTEKGKKYYIKSDGRGSSSMERGIFVKTSELQFVEITGIKLDKEFNEAKVEYRIKRTNITPFGEGRIRIWELKDFRDKIFDKYVIFSKYDDGWRID